MKNDISFLIAGVAEGKAEVIAIIRRKIAKGMSPSAIAEILELDEEYVKRIATLIEENKSPLHLQKTQSMIKSTINDTRVILRRTP